MRRRHALAALAMLAGCAHHRHPVIIRTASLAPLADDTAPHVAPTTTTTAAPTTTEAPAPVATDPEPVYVAPRADRLNWAALAECESGGNPLATNGTDWGAFQFEDGTWHAITGLAGHASGYPYATQLAAAQALYNQRGRQPWPVCGARL